MAIYLPWFRKAAPNFESSISQYWFLADYQCISNSDLYLNYKFTFFNTTKSSQPFLGLQASKFNLEMPPKSIIKWAFHINFGWKNILRQLVIHRTQLKHRVVNWSFSVWFKLEMAGYGWVCAAGTCTTYLLVLEVWPRNSLNLWLVFYCIWLCNMLEHNISVMSGMVSLKDDRQTGHGRTHDFPHRCSKLMRRC